MGQTIESSGDTSEFAQADAESHCLFVISAPSDATIYGCFKAIAWRWRDRLRSEHLWIHGDVPISPDFTLGEAPPPIRRLVEADVDLIARIEVEIGEVRVCYDRTGGHGPTVFRTSFFDEIRVVSRCLTEAAHRQMLELIAELDGYLEVCAAMVTDDLSELMKLPSFKAVTVQRSLNS